MNDILFHFKEQLQLQQTSVLLTFTILSRKIFKELSLWKSIRYYIILMQKVYTALHFSKIMLILGKHSKAL